MAEGTCVFDGCERASEKRRLCSRHYQSEKAAGRLDQWPKKRVLDDHCGVEGCPDPVKAKGFCRRHYWHDWMHGYPEKATSTPEERFWAMVDKDGSVPNYRPDLPPCWEWMGSTTKVTHKWHTWIAMGLNNFGDLG